MKVLCRLRRRAEFRVVYQQGMKSRGVNLVVFALETSSAMVRLGITATRKTGSAVVRNRARRRIRELFRHHSVGRTNWHGDVVVNVRSACAGVAWRDLEEDYLRCMRKATAPRSSVAPL